MACKEAGIGWATLWVWRRRDKKLDDKINSILEARCQVVEDILYKKAVEDENLTAIIFWLCNRYPERWKTITKAEVNISNINEALDKIREIIDGKKKS
ncbi:MAG: hypothetical protein QXN68_00760 [Thermoplasmata archaeon]